MRRCAFALGAAGRRLCGVPGGAAAKIRPRPTVTVRIRQNGKRIGILSYSAAIAGGGLRNLTAA